jgi:photosystem II stability/assembly factor-like uncharacterized protein
MVSSTDGTNWSNVETNTNDTLLKMAHGSGAFVAVGNAGTIITSADGLSWSERNRGGPNLQDVIPLGSGFLVVGKAGIILQGSANGQTWRLISSNTTRDLASVARFANGYIAVGRFGTLLTSSDGNLWKSARSGTKENLWGISVGHRIAAAVGSEGTILTSPDGLHWTKRESGVQSSLICVRWTGNRFVAVGYEGTVLTSPDGTTWTQQITGGLWPLFRVY